MSPGKRQPQRLLTTAGPRSCLRARLRGHGAIHEHLDRGWTGRESAPGCRPGLLRGLHRHGSSLLRAENGGRTSQSGVAGTGRRERRVREAVKVAGPLTSRCRARLPGCEGADDLSHLGRGKRARAVTHRELHMPQPQGRRSSSRSARSRCPAPWPGRGPLRQTVRGDQHVHHRRLRRIRNDSHARDRAECRRDRPGVLELSGHPRQPDGVGSSAPMPRWATARRACRPSVPATRGPR